MMNNIIPFQFENSSIRVIVDENGEPWFVATDVCEALTIINARDAVSKLDDDELQSINFSAVGIADGVINQQLNPGQKINIINESGLYSLIMTSRKPEAKKFKKWVTSEVLPSIRKTGSYVHQSNQTRTRYRDPLIAQYRRADAILQSTLKAARLLGTDLPMARALAVDRVQSETGINYLPLLANNDVGEKPMTPTDLGKLLGLSSRRMNTLLAVHGLQTRNEQDEWVPTDKGKPYCTCNPYKAPHSEHTGYRALWYRTVLELIPVSNGQESV